MADSSDSSRERSAARGTRAEIFAWAMYDWANSAYSTFLITIVLEYLKRVVFPPADANDKWGGTIYAWSISLSMVTAAVLSPIVGALADANRSKRKWLAGTALLGASGAVLMAGVPSGWPWMVVGLFVLVSLCFELSLGVYNAFLPEIADEGSMNMVSAWGFALGYIGGALPLILALVVVRRGEDWGIGSLDARLRVGLLIMGLWWGLFSLPTIWILRDRGERPPGREPFLAATRKAVGEVGKTLANIRRYRYLAVFLIGFLFYNEGVQTVLSQASNFAQEALEFQTDELVLLILMVQFLALPGAMLVGWLSNKLGQKPTLTGCMAVWVVVLLLAFLVRAKWQFWILGGIVAMVMGGTQSLSRAIMGVMTPQDRTGEFFGFFNFSGKATSFLGPFLFGTILTLTKDARLALVSLLIFFLVGWTIVGRLDIAKGRQQALEA